MMRLLPLLVVTAAVAASGACTSQVRPGQSLSVYGFAPEEIDRVEILDIPERIRFRSGVTPEFLERQYNYKIEIRGSAASTQRQRMITALRETSVSPSDRSYDVRTAVLLYDGTGKRTLSLYFDDGGRNGGANRDFVSINSDVYRWAKSMMRGFAD
jgi:hypothetical protein